MILKPETIAQIQVCEWVRQTTDLPFYHFVNEGKRSIVSGKILKRMGMTAGVSDIFMPRGNGTFSGLWIELKIGGNKPTSTQLDFINSMLAEGYSAHVCYGADEAKLVIRAFYGLDEKHEGDYQ